MTNVNYEDVESKMQMRAGVWLININIYKYNLVGYINFKRTQKNIFHATGDVARRTRQATAHYTRLFCTV